MNRDASSRSEARMAWAATLLSALYYLWVGVALSLGLPLVAKMHEGLGLTEGVPAPYGFLSAHSWVFLVIAAVLSGALIVKEARMTDKRRSIIVTCLVAVICLILVDVIKMLLLRPLFGLMEKLS